MGVFTTGKGPEWLSSATVSPIPIIHTQCFCINFVSFLDTGFTSLCTRFWPSGHVARVWSWGTASPQQCWGTWDTCWKQDTNIVPKHNVDCYNSPLKVTSGPSTEIQTKSVLQGPEFSLKQLLSAMGINAKAGLRIVLLLTCCSFHLRHTNLEGPPPPPETVYLFSLAELNCFQTTPNSKQNQRTSMIKGSLNNVFIITQTRATQHK